MIQSPLQDILDEVREGLVGYRVQDIADATGLSWNSIQQIRRGHNTNPTLRTLETLWRFVQDENREYEEFEQWEEVSDEYVPSR